MNWILIVTILIYLVMVLSAKYRTPVAFIGSGLLLTIGSLTSSFDTSSAFKNFPSEIVILIIVLTLFTDNFQRHHLIDYIGYKFVKLTKSNRIIILISLPLLVYATSLFMNNLTVVLLFAYMALYITMEYHLPAVPVLVSIIIGSNIGGAALPWADTPAVILTLYTDFNLLDFLYKMFLPCFFFAIMLSIYTLIYYKMQKPKHRFMPFSQLPNVHWDKLRLPLILFFIYIIAVSIAPFFNSSIAYVSLLFCGLLMICDKKHPMDVLNDLPILDSLSFIIALFLIGGVLQSAGLLTLASEYIISFTNNNSIYMTVAILMIAFITATLLSAGPAAATLLPICARLEPLVPYKFVYVALALGILCGSSMLPWSATGGPIMLSQVHTHLKKPEFKIERKRFSDIFRLDSYLMFSIPFSLIMLTFSLLYLYVVLHFS